MCGNYSQLADIRQCFLLPIIRILCETPRGPLQGASLRHLRSKAVKFGIAIFIHPHYSQAMDTNTRQMTALEINLERTKAVVDIPDQYRALLDVVKNHYGVSRRTEEMLV